MRWPGISAAVEVSLISIHKGSWEGDRKLGTHSVESISTFLDGDSSNHSPIPLKENQDTAFIGSIILGNGFLLTPDEAKRILDLQPEWVNVLKPYLTGSDLNSDPYQRPSRYVIDFGDRSLEQCKEFGELYQKVERDVLPQRSLVKRDTYRVNWWRFAERCPGLYRKIAPMKRVLVVAQVSQTLAFEFSNNDKVFSAKTIVFALEGWDDFSVMQSTIHNVWAWKFCTTMKTDLSYGPTALFQPFPRPKYPLEHRQTLNSIGERYHNHRRQLMSSLYLGLTDIYNLFHAHDLSPELVAKVSKKHADVARTGFDGLLQLRRLHVALDNAVRDAYGWTDLNLGHDFVEVETLPENDRVRYTISPAARKEVLKRLLALNHQRAKEEAAKAPDTKAKGGKRATAKTDPNQPDLI